MSEHLEEPAPAEPDPTRRRHGRWFEPNRSGPGWHPATWQGWLTLAAVVGAIVVVVVLFRGGTL